MEQKMSPLIAEYLNICMKLVSGELKGELPEDEEESLLERADELMSKMSGAEQNVADKTATLLRKYMLHNKTDAGDLGLESQQVNTNQRMPLPRRAVA